MSRPKVAAKDQERSFEIHELFFSTTDRKGVIRGGNDVFRRVAGYDSLDELLGKSHNVIRHPDMPRAVFKLFWDFLQSDKPVAAYVKNIATDGSYYWVMALAVPIPDGYLSVRFKPSSRYFGLIQGIYSEILEIEANANSAGLRQEAMEQSGERLLALLAEQGFASYEEFMCLALAAEMASREKLVGKREHLAADDGHELAEQLQLSDRLDSELTSIFQRVESFLNIIPGLQSGSAFLGNLAEEVHLLALNCLVACHHMAEEGSSLTVVAHDLARISRASSGAITSMRGTIGTLIGELRNSAFQISAAKLQVLIALTFLNELVGHGECTDEMAYARDRADLLTLSSCFADRASEIGAACLRIERPVSALLESIVDISTSMKGLSRVHLIGRVEGAHLDGATRFLQLFDEVDKQLHAAKTELDVFSTSLEGLCDGLPSLGRESKSLEKGLSLLRDRAA